MTMQLRSSANPHRDPAIWYRSDWEQCDDWLVELSNKEIEELELAVNSSYAIPIPELDHRSFCLPKLGFRLSAIRHELISGRGFVLLRGLPVLEWPRETSARAYYGIACHLGQPVPQNAQGHLLGHVIDMGLNPLDPLSRIYQTSYRHLFHTDSADIVGLLCLQTARYGGESAICSSTTIYHEIATHRPDLLETLCQPFHIDRKGEIPKDQEETYEMAVFYPTENNVTCIYARDFIEAAQRHSYIPRLTKKQTAALDLIDNLASSDDLRLDIKFLPGDMQFLHNHQILHARTRYEDWPEPDQKRHLLRLWLSTLDGRSLPEAFEARYGKIVPGYARGGIRVPGAVLHAPLSPS
ncbi:MAG: taurine catabolism dioxygenase TauD [Acidiferrobacteraceae bacterium]|nr:taurine catabolism dioxygenase TauD [Acidiferrobacteraceae bacterium]